jgi:pimeloyl-ACP methyl ester carboxylesterase
VFLHGVTDSSASWDAIASSFVDDYRVMAVDLRGHGQSDKPATGYSWESDYAKDISAFITEQLDEPAIVVGHSLGAVVSAPVAVQARQCAPSSSKTRQPSSTMITCAPGSRLNAQ